MSNRELIDGDRAVVVAMVVSAVLALARLRRQGWWKDDPAEISMERAGLKYRHGNAFQYGEATDEGKWWMSEGPDLLCQLARQVLGRIYTRERLVERARAMSEGPEIDVDAILTGKDG